MFRVWAPHAKSVSIVGDFNDWDRDVHPMSKISDGIWEGFVAVRRHKLVCLIICSLVKEVNRYLFIQLSLSFFILIQIIP